MASVFRQQGSPYWYAAFFDGTGKRLHRTTKQTNKNEAIRVGAELERLARRAAKPQKNENAGEIYRILEEAGKQALRGTLNEAKGREFLNQILEIAAGQQVEIPSIEEWLNTWLNEKKGSRTEGTYLRYEGVIKAFLKTLAPPKRRSPLTALSLKDILKFRNGLQRGGRAATTVNMAVKILRTPLNVARKLGYITHNPAEAIDPITAEVAEKGVFSPEQVALLVGAAQGDWKGLILGGYYTGARSADISNLRWDAVDLETRTILFIQGKAKRRVEMPIHPEFQAWLTQIPDENRSGYIFPSLAEKTSAGRNGLSGMFRRILENAGVEGATIERAGENGRNRSTLTFHSLRHSFNSAMANAGIPQELRQRLTGHASKAVNDRYTHTELEILRAAVEAVPRVS